MILDKFSNLEKCPVLTWSWNKQPHKHTVNGNACRHLALFRVQIFV
jgi:hypothetical protein